VLVSIQLTHTKNTPLNKSTYVDVRATTTYLEIGKIVLLNKHRLYVCVPSFRAALHVECGRPYAARRKKISLRPHGGFVDATTSTEPVPQKPQLRTVLDTVHDLRSAFGTMHRQFIGNSTEDEAECKIHY
jgi:hypothetical protein